jgi:signal peptidase I
MAKADKKDKQTPAPLEQPQETTVEFLASLAGVLVTGLFIITFIVQTFVIPSASMEKTLLIGDHVLVNRVQFAPKASWLGPLLPYRDIHRGDIFVFLHPDPEYAGTYVVKRVMGIPGDRIHLVNGVVYRNGEALDEPYIDHDKDSDDAYRNNFPAVPPPDGNGLSPSWIVDEPSHVDKGELVVPPGMYFAMGDHRGNSLDSRYWGFVPRENVIGRPLFIYWSFETPENQYLKTAWVDQMGFMAHVVIHFFDETRWRRTLQVPR